jgi:hypothetical protein
MPGPGPDPTPGGPGDPGGTVRNPKALAALSILGALTLFFGVAIWLQ